MPTPAPGRPPEPQGRQVVRAWAKLNLGLAVRYKRADGYHALETLVVFLQFSDTLVWLPDKELSLRGGQKPAEHDLVFRAARLVDLKGRLRLVKKIPVAAGLGGGSADAGALLRLARSMGRPLPALETYTAALGTDVAVCLTSQACWADKRGEHIRKFLRVPPLQILLIMPPFRLETGRVYRRSVSNRRPLASPPAGPGMRAWCLWFRRSRNDLEPAARRLCPWLGRALPYLRGLPGVEQASLCGSGPCCYVVLSASNRGQAAKRGLQKQLAKHPLFKRCRFIQTCSLRGPASPPPPRISSHIETAKRSVMPAI